VRALHSVLHTRAQPPSASSHPALPLPPRAHWHTHTPPPHTDNSVCLDCDPAVINHTGTPSCADASLQNDMLRGEWGWDGFIVSDCDAIGNIFNPHAFTPTAQQAAVAGILGGTDVDCGSTYSAHLAAAVANASLPRAALVTAAQRVLTTAFSLGVYDPIGSVPYDAIPPGRLDSADNRALSLEGAIQGMVLLANNATRTPWGAGLQPLLPLRLPRLARLAVIGPLANATQTLLSNYEGQNTLVEGHSIFAALAARGSAAGVAVSLTPGCVNGTGGTTVWCQEATGFPAAAAAAAAADVAVVVVGLCSTCPLDGWRLEGEGHDRSLLTLPGQQEALVAAVVAAGKPVVVVLVHGGPLAIEGVKATVPAILDAHYPGQLGGEAVAAVLLGDASPSGRLTTTYYTAGLVHARPMTDMNIAPHGGAPGLTHLYVPEGEALWPFGWGISYTTFSFSWYNSSSSSLRATPLGLLRAPPVVHCNVTNTGAVASSVSVLGMLSTGLPDEPLQELFDFARVADLAPGATATVALTLPPGIAACVDGAGQRVLRAGRFQLRVGEPGNWAAAELLVEGEEVVISAREATLGVLGGGAARA
jgi:beta-D-xylosidase 4